MSSNIMSNLFIVMKPCAHVTCKTCTDTLVRPGKQCVVCDTQVGDKDIIELKREGIDVGPVSSRQILISTCRNWFCRGRNVGILKERDRVPRLIYLELRSGQGLLGRHVADYL